MLCERCESRAGMREWRAAETELGEGTILGKTILGSTGNGERRCSVPTQSNQEGVWHLIADHLLSA